MNFNQNRKNRSGKTVVLEGAVGFGDTTFVPHVGVWSPGSGGASPYREVLPKRLQADRTAERGEVIG
jgi:hypothetical protein